MIEKEAIQAVKEVDVDIILNEFSWEKNRYGQIRCPHPDHDDRNPSCGYDAGRNRFKCFSCGERFDTIDLYRCLSEKVDGRVVPFYKAVEEILGLDAMAGGDAVYMTSSGPYSQQASYQDNSSQDDDDQSDNKSPYKMIINNSRPVSGYELNYLHSRGIMLYDSYVHGGEVHTVQNINKALQTETDMHKLNQLNEIKGKGTFYKGIAPVLKANHIQIKHNYWQGKNSIIYLIDYEVDDCADLLEADFFTYTESRHMAIQKSLDGQHEKRALGTTDFNLVTQGIQDRSREVYIVEGIEDALTFAMNGKRSISLNSIANLKSLMEYLKECYSPIYNDTFVICLDHDKGGEDAKKELTGFFEAYNRKPFKQGRHEYRYNHAVCSYPQGFKDINDYWKSKVFG